MKPRLLVLRWIVPLLMVPASLNAARVASVTLCEEVALPDLVPINICRQFAADAPAIHALVAVEGLKSGSRIRGTWVSVDATATPNREIDGSEVVAKPGEATIHFSLSRPLKGWPPGNYKLNVHVDGKLASVTTFSVAGATTDAPEEVPPAERRADALAGAPTAAADSGLPGGTGFTGTYLLEDRGVRLTLDLRQEAGGRVTGTLASTAGTRFQLQGEMQDDVATGVCADGQNKVFFEAQMQGTQLLLALIEPDANNLPDYGRARSLIFSRQAGGAVGPRAPAAHAQRSPGRGPPGVDPSGEEAGDPSWGFRLRLPAGWKIQYDANGALLGHDSIAGAIFVFLHAASSREEVQQQMMEGLADENGRLTLTGKPQSIGANAIAADYQGFWQGQQVRARGVGAFSPQGGGAYFVAVATPQAYTRQLADAAEKLAAGMRFVAGPAAGLTPASGTAQHFVGTWVTMTANTQTSYTLMADGTFTGDYEASYSAAPGSGGTTDWGLARQDRNRGRWTARGTREQGTLVLQFPDGRRETVSYRVHVENGQTYWNEYWFDGSLYGRK